MAEVQGERLRAEQELGESVPADKLTKSQIRALVMGLRDIAAVLGTADPKLKAEVYAELGVEVKYDLERRMVLASAGPARGQQSVSENRPASSRTKGHWRLESW
jgi:site-specific DNA recombinase